MIFRIDNTHQIMKKILINTGRKINSFQAMKNFLFWLKRVTLVLGAMKTF